MPGRATVAERGMVESEMPEKVSFADVFRDHYPRVMRLAFLQCGARSRVEDAVAEAMAKVYVRWRAGAVERVGPYLRRAVVNEILQELRRRSAADRALARTRGDLRRRFDWSSSAPEGDRAGRQCEEPFR